MASSRSSALPWGIPSTTSIRTTSASSLAAIQCAAVAPTLPAPTILTFLRMKISPWGSVPKIGSALHIPDDARREFARSDLRSSGSLALKVVSHKLLLNGLLHRIFNQLCCFLPADEIQQHHAG